MVFTRAVNIKNIIIFVVLICGIIFSTVSLASPNKAKAACVSQNFCSYYNDFKYFEQKIVFGLIDNTIESKAITNFTNIPYPLTKDQILDISKLLTGDTSIKLSVSEIDSLYKLQNTKNKLQLFKAIILTVHQHTGALAGRAGVHVRISAENPSNQATNIKALIRVLNKVEPGNRMVVVDLIKASGDLSKLNDPNYNVLGLVENHEAGFKTLINQIKQSGNENKIELMMRIDGSSAGANENIADSDKAHRYELTIKKVTNYLEVMLPNMPVKVIIGNEPDLYVERQWSQNNTASGQARIDFIMNDYAPKIGFFIRKLALERPDITYITPGLSADFKNLNKQYFLALYQDTRLDNMVANFHGYSADVAYIDGGGKNLIHLKADELRSVGIKNYVISELGSGNGFRDSEYFLDKAKFDDAVIWIMLSTRHDSKGQDANWAFFIDPDLDSTNADLLASLINRTTSKVITNILDRTDQRLPILDNIVKPVIKGSLPKDISATSNYNNIYFGTDNIYNAFDGNLNTRWASKNSQQKDMKFEIDLKAIYRLNRISINNTNYFTDNPAGYNIKVSTNGLIFTSVAVGADSKINVSNINKNARYIIIEQTGSKSNWWSIDEFDLDYAKEDPSLPSDSEPPAVTNYNTIYNGPDNILNAFDKNSGTRWSSESKQEPGMFFEINLGAVKKVKGVKLDNEGSPLDYPRGYKVYTATTRSNYTLITQKLSNNAPVDVSFNETDAKFIKVEQTGSTNDKWWSIHEVDIKYKDGTTPITSPTPTPTILITPQPSVTGDLTTENKNWTLQFFSNKTLSGSPVKVRSDVPTLSNGINYDWGWGTPDKDKLPFHVNDFSIIFERNINFSNNSYKFFSQADDGLKVFVDDKLVLDRWSQNDVNSVYNSDQITLSGTHRIKIHYYESSDVAKVKVWYSLANILPSPTHIPTLTTTPIVTLNPIPTVPSTGGSIIIFNAKGSKDKDIYPKIKVLVEHNGSKTELSELTITEEKDYMLNTNFKLSKNDVIYFIYCNDTSDDGKCDKKAGGANRDLYFSYIIVDNKKLELNKNDANIKYDRSNKEDGSKYDWGNYRDISSTDGDFGTYDDGKAVLKGGEKFAWGPVFEKQIPWNGAIIAKINWDN